VCEAKTDYDRAATFLADALRANPDDVASMSILARLSERRRRIEETEKWHRRILEVNPTIGVSNFFLAHRYYTGGDYVKAVPYFEQLLAKEPNNRIYKLYWSLANVKGREVHNREIYLAEIQQWHDFTAEQQQLAGELFLVAGQANFQEGNLPQAEQYLLQANQFAPSPQVSRLLGVIAERLAMQPQEQRQNKQTPTAPREKASSDHWITMCAMILQEEQQQKRQKTRKRVVAGVRIGLAAGLIIGGALGYDKARKWLRSSSSQNKELSTTKPDSRKDATQATSPSEFLTSETWSVVKESSEPSFDERTQGSSSSSKITRKRKRRGL
jgi:tetratricopeptide (TPR) repeat protein